MKILAIDTSSKNLALAILENGRVIVQKDENTDSKRAEGIIDALAKTLKESDLKLKDISGFALGVGPGSFTGLRIGASLIKGFCLVEKCAALPLCSLDLIAYNGLNYAKNICVIVDAKQEKLYCAFYSASGKLKRILAPKLVSPEELIKRAKKFSPLLFIGDGIRLYQNKISHQLKNAIFAEEDYWYPKASGLAALAGSNFKKHATRNLNKINPLYLYPKECQIKSLGKG